MDKRFKEDENGSRSDKQIYELYTSELITKQDLNRYKDLAINQRGCYENLCGLLSKRGYFVVY